MGFIVVLSRNVDSERVSRFEFFVAPGTEVRGVQVVFLNVVGEVGLGVVCVTTYGALPQAPA